MAAMGKFRLIFREIRFQLYLRKPFLIVLEARRNEIPLFRRRAVDHSISRYRYVNNRPPRETYAASRIDENLRLIWYQLPFIDVADCNLAMNLHYRYRYTRMCVTLLLPFSHEYTHTRSKTVSDDTWWYCVYYCIYSHLCKSVFCIFMNSDISVYSFTHMYK